MSSQFVPLPVPGTSPTHLGIAGPSASLGVPDGEVRRRRWQTIGIAALAPLLLIGAMVLEAGPVAPYADTWIAAGIVRALSDRPLESFGMGGVPKAGQLLISAPAALFGSTDTGAVLTLLGALALLVYLVAHVAHWWRDLGGERRFESGTALALVVTAPLAWRTTLDGSSIAWGWTLVIIALTCLRRRTGLVAPALALASAALFRPEAAGSAIGIALYVACEARREGKSGARPLVLLGALPLLVFVLGVVAVDLIWTARIGSSAHSYEAFVGTYAELTPPLLIGVRLALAATLLGVGTATAIGGIIGLASNALRQPARSADENDSPLLAALLAWLAVVLVHRIVGGGGFFDRFFFPFITVFAVGAARLIFIPRRPSLSYALGGALVFSTLVSWTAYGPQVAGPAARGDATRAGAQIAALFPATVPVATDLAVRAVAVGAGLRPWRTTHVVNDPALNPCSLHAIIVRESVLPAETIARATRCGRWRNATITATQRKQGLVVLVRD